VGFFVFSKLAYNKSDKMDKQEIYRQLNNLSFYLKKNLLPKKEDIVKKVRGAPPRGDEPEGYFIKLFLAPLLREFFKGNLGGLIIEGINSKGQTQFKKDFFGSKPAPDFRFKQFNMVGEVNYDKLQLRPFVTALGQLITYIKSSKNETEQSKYGCLIFFNTEESKEPTEREKEFINLMWERENIFIMII